MTPEQWYAQYTAPLVLAMSGGLADFLMSDEHTWMNMISALFLAAFTGYLAALGCQEAGMTEGATGIMAGVAGLSSRGLLRVVKRFSIFKVIYFLEQPTDSAEAPRGSRRNNTRR